MHFIKLLLRIGGCGFLIIAAGILTGTYFLYQHTQNFIHTATRAQATITKMVERSDSSNGTTYAPVFTFKDSAGQEQEVYSSSSQYPPAYRVGDKISVLYLPNDPRHAKIDTFSELWIWTTIVGVFGSMALFGALVQFIAAYFVGRLARK